MKEKRSKCDACNFRGYNPEYCRWHRKTISGIDIRSCKSGKFYRKLGKMAAMGAGIGVVSATAGIAAAPVLGIKALVGHALAAKVTAGGGGAAVAGFKAWRTSVGRRGRPKGIQTKKVLLPFYLLRS